MYYYLHDAFLNDKKYERVLDRIKTRLLDLDVQGVHEKLSLLKSVDELVKDQVKRGVKTIVAVGNDATFLKMIDVVAKQGVTLGLIPVGPKNNLCKSLGVPMAEAACDILAARKIEKVDLGKVNGFYFFSNLKLIKNLTRLSIEKDDYKIIPQNNCVEVLIYNFYFSKDGEVINKKLKKVNSQDGLLDLIVKSRQINKGIKRLFNKKEEVVFDTLIQNEEFKIKSFEYLPLVLDDYKVLKTPVKVEVEPNKLEIIVGRNRVI